MFSGIVEAVGVVSSFEASDVGAVLTVRSDPVMSDEDGLSVSESVSISGACVTVTSTASDTFTVDVSPETLRKTWFEGLDVGSKVNLERALKYGERVGGHLVQGHIDGIAEIMVVQDDGDAKLIEVRCDPSTMRHIVEKGFVALDGVSLTCFDCTDSSFRFTLIPFTSSHTTLGELKPGVKVNIETDMNAKYIEKSMAYFDIATHR